LQAYGADVAAAPEDDRCLALDAVETLAEVLVDGALDARRFLDLTGEIITMSAEAATSERGRVVIFGESVQLLCARGNPETAIRLEKLGNPLTEGYDVEILCGYSLIGTTAQMDSNTFQRICAEHTLVYSQYTRNPRFLSLDLTAKSRESDADISQTWSLARRVRRDRCGDRKYFHKKHRSQEGERAHLRRRMRIGEIEPNCRQCWLCVQKMLYRVNFGYFPKREIA
jgi:hypothetical protein